MKVSHREEPPMSRLTDLLTPRLPEGFTVPEPLDSAWSWMEQQGWVVDGPNGYFVTPYPGPRQLGAVFSAQESLDGWFEPGDPGFDQLVPIAQISGDGGTGAVWIDGDQVRFVALGSDGDAYLLADSPVDFLRLIAVGYHEARLVGPRRGTRGRGRRRGALRVPGMGRGRARHRRPVALAGRRPGPLRGVGRADAGRALRPDTRAARRRPADHAVGCCSQSRPGLQSCGGLHGRRTVRRPRR